MADKQRIRIVSDGTAGGTKVTDVDTGVEIQGIRALSWSCDAESQTTRATVEFQLVEVEVVGDAFASCGHATKCTQCGECYVCNVHCHSLLSPAAGA